MPSYDAPAASSSHLLWLQLSTVAAASCGNLAAFAGREGSTPCSLSIVAGGDTQAMKHWPILAVVEGDTPAMSILMCYCGHTAINACPRCCIPGVYLNNATRCVPRKPPTVVRQVAHCWSSKLLFVHCEPSPAVVDRARLDSHVAVDLQVH